MTNYAAIEKRWKKMKKSQLIEEMASCNELLKKVAVNIKYVTKKIDEGEYELAEAHLKEMLEALIDTVEG